MSLQTPTNCTPLVQTKTRQKLSGCLNKHKTNGECKKDEKLCNWLGGLTKFHVLRTMQLRKKFYVILLIQKENSKNSKPQ